MKNAVKLVGFLLLASLTTYGIYAWLSQGEQPDREVIVPIDKSQATVTETLAPLPVEAVSSSEIAHLTRAKMVAQAAVESAELRISELEPQLDLVEAQIRDIEWSGDDPADRVDEVMPYFEPLFAQYLDAQADLELALKALGDADAAVASAIAKP